MRKAALRTRQEFPSVVVRSSYCSTIRSKRRASAKRYLLNYPNAIERPEAHIDTSANVFVRYQTKLATIR
ncbi:MAG: hypothetical protein ACI8TQ_003888 [Planctomycetota bacterium]|jgi:hypothetical protein